MTYSTKQKSSYIIDTFLLWSNFLVKSLPGGTKTDIHEGTGVKNMHQLLLGFALQLFASAAFVQWWCELVLQRMVVRVEVRVRAAIQQAVSARE